ILTGADDVTPADLSGMDEAVQAFVRDKLQLRPEDFDIAARQKFLDYEVIRNTPRLSNPKSAAGAPVTEEIKEASEAIGMSVKQVRREVYAVASQIAKRTITGR